MLVIKYEELLSRFEFWGQGEQNAKRLTDKDLDNLGDILADEYPEGIDETTLNDIMSDDFAEVCYLLGLEYDEENDIIIDYED